jgi:hypothetical protein
MGNWAKAPQTTLDQGHRVPSAMLQGCCQAGMVNQSSGCLSASMARQHQAHMSQYPQSPQHDSYDLQRVQPSAQHVSHHARCTRHPIISSKCQAVEMRRVKATIQRTVTVLIHFMPGGRGRQSDDRSMLRTSMADLCSRACCAKATIFTLDSGMWHAAVWWSAPCQHVSTGHPAGH